MHRPAPYWSADAGGEGGGQQQQANQQQNDAGGWKAPDGLPPEYAGKDAAETLGKLLPAFTETSTRANGLRDKLATLPKVPDSPDGYQFTPNDALKPFFQGDLNANPVLKQARAAMHKHGVGEKAFQGIIEDLYGPLIEQGQIAAPYDAQAEIRAFREGYGLDETATGAALKEAETFATGLFGQLKGIPDKLAKSAQAEMMVFAETAGGMAVLRALQARLGENGIRVPTESQGGNAGGPLNREQLQTMSRDPRIDPANRHAADPAQRFDPALRKQYDDGYAALGAGKN